MLALAALAPGSAPASDTGFVVSCTAGAEGVDRLLDCSGESAALGRAVGVRVLKPVGYRETGAPHPVLLLLHGCCSSFEQGHTLWTRPQDGNAQEVTAGSDFLIVMPAADHHGWYTDWLDGPRWETHHLREILPWVEATYNVSTERSQRFVAGLSMGGYGAMAYAARHPDLFAGAASYSGAVDITLPGAQQFIDVVLNGSDQGKVWGDPVAHEIGWRANNPVDLARNLGALQVIYLTTGAGAPGEPEVAAWRNGASPSYSQFAFEVGVNRMTHNLSDALTAEGIQHELRDYVVGTHIWDYWRAELAATLPKFAAAAQSPETLERFDYRAAAPSFEAFDWHFAADPARAPEFLEVRDAGADGVTLVGSGLTHVRTAPLFAPGQAVTLQGATDASAIADAEGRIAFSVDLGPAHSLKQYSPEQRAAEAASAGSYFTARAVTFD